MGTAYVRKIFNRRPRVGPAYPLAPQEKQAPGDAGHLRSSKCGSLVLRRVVADSTQGGGNCHARPVKDWPKGSRTCPLDRRCGLWAQRTFERARSSGGVLPYEDHAAAECCPAWLRGGWGTTTGAHLVISFIPFCTVESSSGLLPCNPREATFTACTATAFEGWRIPQPSLLSQLLPFGWWRIPVGRCKSLTPQRPPTTFPA